MFGIMVVEYSQISRSSVHRFPVFGDLHRSSRRCAKLHRLEVSQVRWLSTAATVARHARQLRVHVDGYGAHAGLLATALARIRSLTVA